MFGLFVVLFAITNGTPDTDPTEVMRYRLPFKTEQACKDFLQSDEGSTTLKDMAKAADGAGLVAKFACKKIAASKEDDGSL
jgi:hypothetical protein